MGKARRKAINQNHPSTLEPFPTIKEQTTTTTTTTTRTTRTTTTTTKRR